jgi:serine/threonine-protein kinase RsbW
MEALKAKATLENLDIFLNLAKQFIRKVGFESRFSCELKLVVEEVIVNIANYAYPQGEGDVEITFSMDNNTVSFCTIDEGIPFNMNWAEDPDMDFNIEKKEIGGMGIFLVKHFMDEIKYERKRNKNILTLVKHF